LRVHKPYIDAVSYDSPFAPGGRMQRVPEVIDCWYDSGAMPFAQWGYPHQGRRAFLDQFPADFISEALDQTRGWFYSQLAISTLLFGDDEQPDPDARRRDFPHPFRNCVVLGLMLGEDGGKMSKSKRNYREPQEVQPVALDFDSLQRVVHSRQHSRVSAAAVERLQFLRDLRQH
jgi:isoleucyl-tRNA synthetase